MTTKGCRMIDKTQNGCKEMQSDFKGMQSDYTTHKRYIKIIKMNIRGSKMT